MKEFLDKIANVSVGTWIRTVLVALSVLNLALKVAGINPIPIDENKVVEVVTLIFNVFVLIYAFWKNNSFTSSAIKADKIMHALKDGKKVKAEIEGGEYIE